MADTDTINELFAPPGSPLPSDVINEILVLMRLHSISPQELFYKWESYVMRMGVENTQMEYKTVRDFKKHLEDVLERESRAKGHVLQSATKKTAPTPRGGGGADVFGVLDGMTSATPGPKMTSAPKRKAENFATPAAKSVKKGVNSSPSDFKTPATAQATAFEDRQNAGQVLESLNGHLPAAIAPSEPPTEPGVKLTANVELHKFAYKGMAMKLSEASEILDDRIDNFTDLVQEHHQLPDNAFGNPAAQSTAQVVAVGRIACDQPNGKLNAASLVLETSRRMGAGMRVPLRLEGLSYDFFPGKIVALRGTNVSGEYFAVIEVLEMPSLPVAASTPDELDVHNDRLTSADGETRPLSMLLASGPYTTETDLSFAPLHALLEKASAQQPDILILTGPFLDLEHPLIASGDFAPHLPSTKIDPDRTTLTEIFHLLIAQPLQKLAQAIPTITIILVPSLRDAINKHPSYPQDRFPRQPFGLPKQVQIVTNPITLSVNEALVGISTQDILSELRRENVYSAGSKGRQAFDDDMLARLTSAVIEQRHFFPLFPAQARENLGRPTAVPGEVPEAGGHERLAVGASLDLAYLKLGEWMNVRPDVLVLPSVLSPFAKVRYSTPTSNLHVCKVELRLTSAGMSIRSSTPSYALTPVR